jgi:hypothetical protein
MRGKSRSTNRLWMVFREGAENMVKDAIDVAKKLQPTLEM